MYYQVPPAFQHHFLYARGSARKLVVNRLPLLRCLLATSTAVRLLPQNWVLHNRKYFVFCASAEVVSLIPFEAQPTRVCVREESKTFCSRLVRQASTSPQTDEGQVRSDTSSFIARRCSLLRLLVAGLFAYIYN